MLDLSKRAIIIVEYNALFLSIFEEKLDGTIFEGLGMPVKNLRNISILLKVLIS